MDDPYGDPIILSLDSLASEIKKSRVCLTGEGVDEILIYILTIKFFPCVIIAFKYNLKFVINHFNYSQSSKNLIKKFISYS